jgi:hypothetical protein
LFKKNKNKHFFLNASLVDQKLRLLKKQEEAAKRKALVRKERVKFLMGEAKSQEEVQSLSNKLL